MPVKTTPFDAAEYLETDEDIKIFLRDAAEDGNAEVFLHALNTVARAKGMTEIAKKSGLTRASLYKALAEGANPRFDTINKVTGH
jgi:probable addiction module antidote protein